VSNICSPGIGYLTVSTQADLNAVSSCATLAADILIVANDSSLTIPAGIKTISSLSASNLLTLIEFSALGLENCSSNYGISFSNLSGLESLLLPNLTSALQFTLSDLPSLNTLSVSQLSSPFGMSFSVFNTSLKNLDNISISSADDISICGSRTKVRLTC
jgi:hypothetical protein